MLSLAKGDNGGLVAQFVYIHVLSCSALTSSKRHRPFQRGGTLRRAGRIGEKWEGQILRATREASSHKLPCRSYTFFDY